MERTGGSFLQAIFQEDRSIFQADSSQGEQDVREYRMLDRAGNPVWVNEVRTLSFTGDGRKIWVCSLRLIDEDHRRRRLSQEAFSLMKDTYYRISAIDLGLGRIETLKLEGMELQEEGQFQGDYRQVLEHCVQNYVDEEFREKVRNVLSPENLCAVLETSREPISFTYRRLVSEQWKASHSASDSSVTSEKEESIWVRSEVIPMKGYTPEHPVVMWYVRNMAQENAQERNLSDALLTYNASLRKSLSEEEQYRQAIISEALFVFNVNVSRNIIEDDFYKIAGEEIQPSCPWWVCMPPVARMPFSVDGENRRYCPKTGRFMTATSICSI